MDNLNHKDVPWVLLIEDDTDLRMTVELMIQDNGYKVLGASNGVDAIKIMIRALRNDHMPCLIITDLNMPIFSGWELLDLLDVAINPKLKNIPVIITSGERLPPDLKPHCKSIRKPYTEDQLMAEVGRATKCSAKND